MTSDGARMRPEDSPEEMEDIDPGLARERTELAWTRTAISFAAVGVVILKTSPVAGGAVLALGALVWGIGRLMRRYERDLTRQAGAGERPRLLLLITITVTAVSLIAVAVAVVGGTSPLTPR